MEEKRKSKRLDLDVRIHLERLDENDVTTLRYVHVDVTDLSKSGIGFTAKHDLAVNSLYETRIQIWTKEVIHTVIKIVRREETEDGYHYGCLFVGMTDTDALKIDIYRILNDQ